MKKNFVFLLVSGFLFMMFCGIAHADTSPVPNIKTNGSDDPIELNASETLNVTISLNAGDHKNEAADWWILQLTPDGNLYYFDLGTLSMMEGYAPTLQAGLVSLADIQILSLSGLQEGLHFFYFGVDLFVNGDLDIESLYYDYVQVSVKDIVPTPTNLNVCGTGSLTEFNPIALDLCWSPSQNPLIIDYEIVIYDTATLARRRTISNIRGCKTTYNYNMNKEDGGGTPEDALTIQLWAVNVYDQKSNGYTQISVTNPPPANVGAITAESWFKSMRFKWTPNSEPDISHYAYCVHVGDGNPATGSAFTSWQAAQWGETYNQAVEISMISYLITDAQIDATYLYGGPYVYVMIKAVDTWGNLSAAGTFAKGFPGRP